MNIAVDGSKATESTVVTVDFKGSIDFKVDEFGMVIDGDKTITHQELYEMIRPIEEKEEEVISSEFTDEIELDKKENTIH